MKKINYVHKSVLLDEVIKNLDIKPNGTYIDCTLGGGGHSQGILQRLKEGHLIAFDKDSDAILHNQELLKKFPHKLKLINDDFINLKKHIKTKVDGIILDAGVSSHQIDQNLRGFSFQKDGPLDMRMNQNQKLSAYDIVNHFDLDQIVDILFHFGEEKYAKQIANAICDYRKVAEIKTTFALVKIIKNATPKKYHLKKHPAKKTFQALRIATNDELKALQTFVAFAPKLLKEKGRILIITFHSLEDRIVKNGFKKLINPLKTPKKIPTIDNLKTPYTIIFKKPIIPSKLEQKNNPRSKSAKLRIILKKGEENE